MRYRGVCSYDGRMYCGWQRQGDERKLLCHSVQYKLEEALKKLYKGEVLIQGASRTDSGVHAMMQMFHYDVDLEIPRENIVKALNKLLPDDIIISLVEPCSNQFHCRYDVVQKTYRYTINTGEYDVFKAYYEYQYGFPIDVNLVREAFPLFLKKFDFRALMASGSDKVDCVREIKSFEVFQEGERVVFEITADGFLYHMVRIIIGALLNLNERKLTLEEIKRGISEYDRQVFKRTAPACGLCLWKIFY